MTAPFQFRLMGQPALRTASGEPVVLKTRKALAIIAYLCRCSGHNASRETIAELLWGSKQRDKAAQSLRQALRLIRKAEKTTGEDILTVSGAIISLAPGAIKTDLDTTVGLLALRNAEGFDQAGDSIDGDFLAGLEALDPGFGEWLTVERSRILEELTRPVVSFLENGSVNLTDERCAAAAAYLLSLDPANEYAHQILISHYKATERNELAHRQFQECEREMRAAMDCPPSEKTKALISGQTSGHVNMAQTSLTDQNASKTAPAIEFPPLEDPGAIRLPVISIASFAFGREDDFRAHTVRDEIVAGLSAYRAFELYESAYWPDGSTPPPAMIQGGELGSYILRFRRDRDVDKIYVQLEDNSNGHLPFNEVINLRNVQDEQSMHETVFRTVSRVHSQVIDRLRRVPGKTPFARWCKAESLLWEFNPNAETKAIEILDTIERDHRDYSLVYAGRASIWMKQMLYFPHKDVVIPDLNSIQAAAEKAAMLDPWQVLNHRMYGWALLQQGYHSDGRRAFREALRLNPLDPMNLLSAAEAIAVVGGVDEALGLAQKGFDSLQTVPRAIYGYLANVHYHARNFEKAAEYAVRAQLDNLPNLITRIAALQSANRKDEAAYASTLFLRRFEEVTNENLQVNPSALAGWLNQVLRMREPEMQLHMRKALHAANSDVFPSSLTFG